VTHTFESFDLSGGVGIAGTGRMARALGALLVRRGVSVSAVGGCSIEATEEAARFIGAERAAALGELPHYARNIVIAVTDSAIPEVAAALAEGGLEDGIVLHTSGAAGPGALEILRKAGNSVGVLHPLQTVPTAERGVESLPGATFAFAGDEAATAWAVRLTTALGGRALRVDPKFWQHYHAGAVMACNYQMTLVDAALELMGMAGIGRDQALDALGPILRETTENVLKRGPERALTGPIRRGDAGTIQRHLAAVENASPETRQLYLAAGLRTIPVAKRAGLEQNAAQEVEKILRAETR
jgi:predicted short-subunit dehydrogenase-like oxidoreductase (DUF2520 family)